MQVWIGCVGNSKITNLLKTVDRGVLELWYRTVRSRNKNIIMSSFKSSRNIQKKEGGPDSCFG